MQRLKAPIRDTGVREVKLAQSSERPQFREPCVGHLRAVQVQNPKLSQSSQLLQTEIRHLGILYSDSSQLRAPADMRQPGVAYGRVIEVQVVKSVKPAERAEPCIGHPGLRQVEHTVVGL